MNRRTFNKISALGIGSLFSLIDETLEVTQIDDFDEIILEDRIRQYNKVISDTFVVSSVAELNCMEPLSGSICYVAACRSLYCCDGSHWVKIISHEKK